MTDAREMEECQVLQLLKKLKVSEVCIRALSIYLIKLCRILELSFIAKYFIRTYKIKQNLTASILIYNSKVGWAETRTPLYVLKNLSSALTSNIWLTFINLLKSLVSSNNNHSDHLPFPKVFVCILKHWS